MQIDFPIFYVSAQVNSHKSLYKYRLNLDGRMKKTLNVSSLCQCTYMKHEARP